MEIEIEQQDIEAIAQRVLETLKPLIARLERSQGNSGNDGILDVKELAEYLKVKSSWIYKQVSHKTIPYFKSGKYPRFRKRDIDKWIESRTTRPITTLN